MFHLPVIGDMDGNGACPTSRSFNTDFIVKILSDFINKLKIGLGEFGGRINVRTRGGLW